MSRHVRSTAARAAAVVALLFTLPLASCGGRSPADDLAARSDGATDSSGTHSMHGQFACLTCHRAHGATGGMYYLDPTITFPRGTTTAGASMWDYRTGAGAQCLVACHFPIGAEAHTEWWFRPGPLQCTACHSNVPPTGLAVRSSHPSGDRAVCTGCHVHSRAPGTGRHTEGLAVLVTGSGDAACVSCHSGNGAEIAGRTPPLLPGWTDAVAGDFHGARGATPPLACGECHAEHASGNAFLFAPKVAGQPIPDGAVNRAGVGAEAICEKCHAPPRHQGCTQYCHDHGPAGDRVVHLGDPIPAGTPCLACHGHEGIVNFRDPAGCSHCHAHSANLPVPEYAPPQITALRVTGVTDTTAVVSWTTNEAATSYAEYGTTALGRTAGSGALTTSHSVTLSGLAQSTDHLVRVRSSDQMRNVSISATTPFTTLVTGGPTVPVPVDQPDVATAATTVDVTLRWSAASDPTGAALPIRYRVQVSTAASFAALLVDDLVTATSATRTLANPGTYYWRVRAEIAVDPFQPSPWAATDAFTAVAVAAPPAPVGIDQPDFCGASDPQSTTLRWKAIADPQGYGVEYQVQVSDSASFSAIRFTSAWTGATAWTLSLASEQAWYWRVRSRWVTWPTATSGWSAGDRFCVSMEWCICYN